MVDLEIDDGLAVVTIDRPHARNAIGLDTMDQLEKALDAAAGAQALVIKGAGEHAFVSGGDLKELSALRTEEDAAAMARRMRSICDQLADFPAPVVAALNGHAFGGVPKSPSPPTSGWPPTTSRSPSTRCSSRSCPRGAGPSGWPRWSERARRSCWPAREPR